MPETAPSNDPQTFPPPWNYLIPLCRRVLIWVVFFAILYLLRQFLPLVFLTFVFAYLAEHGVEGLAHRIESRRWRTTIIFGVMIAVFAGLSMFLAPSLKDQAVKFVNDLPAIQKDLDAFLDKQRKSSDFFKGLFEGVTAETVFNEVLGGSGAQDSAAEKFHETYLMILGVFRNAAAVLTTFIFALLFAFLIVADMPRMARGVLSLKRSKVGAIYDELSRTVFRFAQVLGRFLEAQLVIALVNTVLTAAGMLLLGIEQVAFLSGVVFLCSFIPVAGVFISTAPICLVALQSSGFSLVVWVVVMVLVVHALEGYVLNPLIFGAHLNLNPVLVLAVLMIGHKLFGVWGLLLGVPTVTYIFRAIKEADPPDDAGLEEVAQDAE